ncbi:YihY/virulence factor BrkB family protein [Aeromicrobium wangtongii]|uniref:YihY/virulence factor BrkB family protein n=1 Tax=Aeromicrobium wangtongii TaxID=2969247 RepID=A0ABY5MAW1_9ACTN|nr:YihY/virulence factor BrkB family protein [Aeromicrobium wangtongii]MCD9196771.1 YihY/virulence factor BrkB family protein [Aeromicrobium wangtongii]MCL3817738.1 YihY/virulence factor BrkB family protein [Aeromicrobium wangtongii]UUP14281.1 YihY/virulence factor BrkB family protein [Aeromicrobium wangtongii]
MDIADASHPTTADDVPRPVGRIDAFQRKHRFIGVPLAIVYKYFDDQGAYLSAIITYYAFIAIFPLLLLSTSILGFVLQDNPGLRNRLLDSALSQFPIVGDQLGRPEGLQGSAGAIVVGALTATYGAMGLGQALQNAANIAWSVPRNSRANPILLRLRSLAFLLVSGLGVMALAIVTSVLSNPGVLGTDLGPTLGWLVRLASFLLTVVIFASIFRLVSLGRARLRAVLPGAFVTGVFWQVLQFVGNTYVREVIGKADNQVNQTFALVLGLVAFIYIASIMVVMGLEVNVVLRRRLYPRALLTPFTDNVILTEADERAYAAYAKSQRHKGFETVEVTFQKRSDGSV